MSLGVELNAKLDTSDSMVNLQGNISLSLADLDLVELPELSTSFDTAASNNSAIDLNLITEGLQAVLGNLNPVLDNLDSTISLQSIPNIVELTQQLSELDVPSSITELQNEFTLGLGGNEAFIEKLSAFADILDGNVSLQKLRELIESVIDMTGSDIDVSQFNMAQLLPAVDTIVKLVGHLMTVFNQLDEGKALAAVIANQLDHERISAAVDQVEKQLGLSSSQTLEDFLQTLDLNEASQVALAKQALSNVNASVVGLHDAIAEGMAFGEATLVQLDPSGLKTAIGSSAGVLNSLDISKFEDLIRSVADKLEPLFLNDLEGAPAQTLDAWLSLLETKTADLASDIDKVDIANLMSPITQGLEAVLALPNALNAALQTLKLELKQGLDSIKEAIQAVPVEQLVAVIQQVLEPITSALNFISDTVANIQAALGNALATLQAALDSAQGAVDVVKGELEQVFQTLKSYVDSLSLDEIIGEVAQQIQVFASALSKADMSPYFDQVNDVINTTSSVIDKVPFDLLPDSMEQEVVDLVKPIKEVDLNKVEGDIKNLLQIGEDGKFELRPELEAALSNIQEKYDEVLSVIAQGNPQFLAEELNTQLHSVRDKIAELTPNVALEPIQEAIDNIKGLIGEFNLNDTLAPLNEGFDTVLEKVDEFNPTRLLTELEDSLANGRAAIFGSLQLDRWSDEIVALRQQALDLLDPLDPAQLEPALQSAIDQIKQQSQNLPTREISYLFGSFIQGILGGQAGKSRASDFMVILNWMTTEQATSQLVEMSQQASLHIQSAFDAAAQVKPNEIVVQLQPQINKLASALETLPDSDTKQELVACVDQLNLESSLGQFAVLQARYLSSLQQANSDFIVLANEGLSEIDLAVGQLKTAFEPLEFAKTFFKKILEMFGVSSIELGVQAVVNEVFDLITPARLAAILSPIFIAFKGRITALIDGFLDPILAAIEEIKALEEHLSLNFLISELDEIYQTTKNQILLLHPNELLGETKAAFEQTQSDVLAFNPLDVLNDAISNLQNSSTSLLDQLDAEEILKTPIEIFEDVLSSLESIDLQNLLKPILDVLDNLSEKVSKGLGETTEAFGNLQNALPDQVGSTTFSVNLSAGS